MILVPSVGSGRGRGMDEDLGRWWEGRLVSGLEGSGKSGGK